MVFLSIQEIIVIVTKLLNIFTNRNFFRVKEVKHNLSHTLIDSAQRNTLNIKRAFLHAEA
jgi:hypothetical protein